MDHALDIQAIEDLIRQYMSQAKAQGIPIMPGSFGTLEFTPDAGWGLADSSERKRTCPLGTVIIGIPAKALDWTGDFTRLFGWTSKDIMAFCLGFDGYLCIGQLEIYALGAKFRQECAQGLWG